MIKIFKYLLLLLLAAGCFLGFLYIWSDILRPELLEEPIYYSPDKIEYTKELRDITFTEDDIYQIQKDVNYSEGELGLWYPKSESPLFADLVIEGKLPPVIERVGSEPVVLNGVDGIGRYGGTWLHVVGSPSEVGVMGAYYSGATLVRFSPLGYPIVPHIAKSWESSPDKREWTFYLRRGMKWSDGHPFTAEDILYRLNVELNPNLPGNITPDWMKIGGKRGEIVKIDDNTVKFVFPQPYGTFLERLARATDFCAPRHYLEKYHPKVGDIDLIETTLKARRLPSSRSLYILLKSWANPEHPRLWPWIYRTYKANPPHVFVRNPYYWAVDLEGNQLPYVDQCLFEVKNYNLIPISASSGAITFLIWNMDLSYTLLMSQREANDYEVYHWFPATRSRYLIHPNLNLLVDPDNPVTQMKHDLLIDKRFRQALSYAINRQQVIDIVYNGVGEPAQLSPGRESYFHHEKLHKNFTEYAPEKADQLLDMIGLTKRDSEGYRTFKDGTRMIWDYSLPVGEDEGPTELIIEDWGRVGIRAIRRSPSLPLFWTQQNARQLEISIWATESEFNPIVGPERFLGATGLQALGYSNWYFRGGLLGDPEATQFGGIEPPIDHPLRRSMEIAESVFSATTHKEQRENFNKIFDIAAENVWSINITTPPPHPVVVKNNFKNVPRLAFYGNRLHPPSHAGLETFYFEDAYHSTGTIAKIKKELIEITPAPYGLVNVKNKSKSVNHLALLIKYLFIFIFACGIIMMGVRHPYIGRRLLIMVPSLIIISIISFLIIQLPPGNFIETKILELQLRGSSVDMIEAEKLREMFHLDRPIVEQYGRWLGLYWFTSFEKKDQGLLQGHMGLSMENQNTVNEVVGDRILLTFLI